jgi:hypothetical protein
VRAEILLDGDHASHARDYAARLNEAPEMAAAKGMEEMAGKFRDMGGKVYVAN